MKSADFYERSGKIYIHSSSKTTAGVRMMSPPVITVGKENANELGESIRECLEASLEGIPHPKVFTGLLDPLLNLAGVKSYSAFAKLTKSVDVQMDDAKTVTFTPTRNGVPSMGLRHYRRCPRSLTLQTMN